MADNEERNTEEVVSIRADGGNPKNADIAADAMICRGRLRIKVKTRQKCPGSLMNQGDRGL